MKPMTLVILCSALAIAGCGDKNDSGQSKSESGSLMDQAKEMTNNTTDSMKDAAADASATLNEAADAAQESAANLAGQASAAADTAVDTATAAAESVAAGAGEMADNAMATAQDAAGAAASATEETVADATQAVQAITPAAGEATAAAGAVAPAMGAADFDLAAGQAVYDGKCKACHATGAAGSPKLDDVVNWAPRIEQGMDVLVKHALEGYKGSVGYMPPKGGFTSLSDDEVAAAVAYMVNEVR